MHVLRDERPAGYLADANARVTGTVGVCEGPNGGGATYMVPGLVEANESSLPILAITTDIADSARGKYTLTKLDQTRLFARLTKWNSAASPQVADHVHPAQQRDVRAFGRSHFPVHRKPTLSWLR